ncbi:S-adenosyl-L-methionine-dependent methyltransferase [Polyporus arcularius HHB13444]|uniref:S-adenosyl-L-methionine-dependent methyltransferase n=1 Tax=Polyporus arcularius HHB13444 TaxID=1314778 RepID=A0A5C3PGJ4_9APHY|nr:S-adenosyl-L-methionine-dependent methyltransferase [Polyporus arcularius HHB13444]
MTSLVALTRLIPSRAVRWRHDHPIGERSDRHIKLPTRGRERERSREPLRPSHSTVFTMGDLANDTQLTTLLSLLTTSVQTIEAELKAANLPPFTLEPKYHPLDSLDAVPTPRLHEARRVAMAASNMIKALVQDVGTAMMDMSTQSLDQAAYIMTADIQLIDVFHTEQEKTAGLHVNEIVARLPEGKKVDPQKLARCLRLLSTEHWWIEPSSEVFAPLRWALINTTGSSTWAWADPVSYGTLVGSVAFTEQMTDPAKIDDDTIDAAPFVRGFHRMGMTHIKNWWDWFMQEPDRLERFARSMEGSGYINLAAIKVDYPWESLAPNTTFVDVGSGQGSVSMHILKHVYDKVPTLKVVLQDRPQHIEQGRKFWAVELPAALADGRVSFEAHDFFTENPRKEPNTIYWFRFIMHDWTDDYAIKILKGIRASCHSTSKVLLGESVMLEALPSLPSDSGVAEFEASLKSIDNTAPYQPLKAPYPIPQNYGFATKTTAQYDILMYNLLNALERTMGNFEKIVAASGFKIDHVYATRGTASIIELVPI